MEQRERNIRAAIAWRLFEVGDAVTRLAHKISDEIPTVATASSGWFAEGQRMGHRAGIREARALFVEATPMSTENESPTTEGLHPKWCDFEGECTDKIVSHPVHYGRRKVWHPVEDDRRVSIALMHGEDHMPKGDPVDHGKRTIVLSIATGGDDGGEEVCLNADDARFLAQQMVAYAEALERDPRWYTREHLGMTTVEYAVDQGILEQHADGTVSLSSSVEAGR